MRKKFALLLAGGSGLRAGGSIPKQFREICGRPILWHSLKAFKEEDPATVAVVVLHPDYASLWQKQLESLPATERFDCITVSGGKDRPDSVANGLNAVAALLGPDEDALVAVHDGARPLVSSDMIRRGWETAAANGTAVPVTALTDSIRMLDTASDFSSPSRAVDRTRYVAVQTPQVFGARLLLKAYAMREVGRTYTDDASVVEPLAPIALFDGDPANIKVTHPRDFLTAEASLLRSITL